MDRLHRAGEDDGRGRGWLEPIHPDDREGARPGAAWCGMVPGPARSMADALALLHDGPTPDLAVLDINL